MFEDIIILTLTFLLFFFLIRAEFAMLLNSLIKNRRHREKRKEGQSFIDWFFYKRFLDIFPKFNFIIYYFNIILYFICMISIIVLYSLEKQNWCKNVFKIHFYIIAISILIFYYTIKSKNNKKNKD